VSTLALQQRALLAALRQPRHGDAMPLLAPWVVPSPLAARGLRAYRSNAHELAVRVLAAAYPVLAQLMDEDNFAPLARSLWQHHPPASGDLAQWGGALAGHIGELPQLAAEPYLADVARAEWCLHRAATAADVAADMASFALLTQHDAARLRLVPAPGTAAIPSAYPVASIMLAHLHGSPTLDTAGRRLRDGVAETALAWRHGLKPVLREAVPGEAAFVAALKESASLADSLAAAPQLDFQQWLVPAVQGGLVVGVAAIQPEENPS